MAPEYAGVADAEADLPSTLPDYTDGEWQKFMRERQADIDEYVKEKMTEVRMAPEYAGVALQMACALTDRIPADSKVHQLPLPARYCPDASRGPTPAVICRRKRSTRLRARLLRTGRRLKARSPLPGNWLPARRRPECLACTRNVFVNICLSRNSERTVDMADQTGSIRCT